MGAINWILNTVFGRTKSGGEGRNRIDSYDTGGHTRLTRAVLEDRADEVTRLLEDGADPLKPEERSGLLPLEIAAISGNIHSLKVLLKHEEVRDSINEISFIGKTRVSQTESPGFTALFRLMQNAPFPYPTRHGGSSSGGHLRKDREERPQWNDVRDQFQKAADLLLENGADPHWKNREGISPVDLALKKGYHLSPPTK